MKDARLLEESLLKVIANWLGVDVGGQVQRTGRCAVVRPARRRGMRPPVLTIRPRYDEPGEELGAA